MKLTRNYLTSDEIIALVNTLKEIENPTSREIMKIGLIYQLLVEEDPNYETVNEYYDDYVKQSDADFINFDIDVINAYEIDKLVEEEIGVNKIIKEFFDGLNVKIDELTKNFGNINQEELFNQMKGLVDSAKTV